MSHENVVPRMMVAQHSGDTRGGGRSIRISATATASSTTATAIESSWEPNAITDGDSFVHFRRADVIVTGDVFTTTQFPFIDVANGGTVQGEINALNDIHARTVYEHG